MDLSTASIAFAITLIGSLWKTFNLVGGIEKQLAGLDHKIEKVELTLNGVRERMEHLGTRLTTTQQAQQRTIDQVEAFLAKNTAYEPRG